MTDKPIISAEDTKAWLDGMESDERLYQSMNRQELAAATLKAFAYWLHLPDPSAVLFVLAVAAANHLDGDPVWGQLVGAPGSGKTEILSPLARLDHVHVAATLTEPALLSGTPKREASGSGGLLREIGQFGIILAKDFGSILSMHRDARAAVLMALREIYDGSWTRRLGTDGGKELHWSGKIGFLAGVTEAIDQHHSVQAAFGERFLTFRMPDTDSEAQAAKALEFIGQEATMRRQLAGYVERLYADMPNSINPEPLPHSTQERLVSLATLATRARSAVDRDPYTREITHVHQNEGPARLVKQLANLHHGLDYIGATHDQKWHVVTKTAFDSIPPLRAACLDTLALFQTNTTKDIATAINHPTTTTRRALEELNGHGVVSRKSAGQGNSDTWTINSWASDLYWKVKEMPTETELAS